MAESRIRTLQRVLSPKIVWLGGGIVTAVGAWDSFSNQFPKWHLPKLGDLLPAWAGVTGALLPWWGWLLILQSVFVYGLFEYVRISIPVASGNAAASQQPAIAAVPRSLADGSTKSMAGRIRQLGEVVRAAKFSGFGKNTSDELYFNDIRRSAHVIWTRPDALQLRRDLQDHIARVIGANKADDMKARTEAILAMDQTIEALNDILMGKSLAPVQHRQALR